jgi:tape measure domain-containing protein
MAASIAKLAILLTTDTSGMQRGFTDAAKQAQAFGGRITELRGHLLSTFGAGQLAGLSGTALAIGGIAVAAAGAGAALYKLASYSLQVAAATESAGTSFKVMLGSAADAQALMGELRGFAARTPFGFSDLQDATKTLLQFGIAGDEVMQILRTLGDVSGGNAARLQQMALAFAQMHSAGRLMGQDLLQMINAGFNPLKVISDQTGLSIGELKKKMEEGAISTEMVTAAFQLATMEGGMFHNGMAEASQTLSGLWSTFKDELKEIAILIGEQLLPLAKALLEVSIDGLRWVKSWFTDAGSVAEGAETAQKSADELRKAFDPLVSHASQVAKEMEKMQQRAEALERSLRTPMEIFKDSAREANELLDAGLISVETWGKAIEKAGEAYKNATKAAQMPSLQDTRVGAADRFSVAGFSAVQQAKSAFDRMLAMQQEEVKLQQENNRLNAELLDVARQQKPTQVKVVTSL